MEQPVVPLLTPKKRNKSSRKQDKKDRREKDQINKIFSSDVIRYVRIRNLTETCWARTENTARHDELFD